MERAPPGGIEPPASRIGTERSAPLNYGGESRAGVPAGIRTRRLRLRTPALIRLSFGDVVRGGHDPTVSDSSRAGASPPFVDWCRRQGSNLHDLAVTAISRRRVCRFTTSARALVPARGLEPRSRGRVPRILAAGRCRHLPFPPRRRGCWHRAEESNLAGPASGAGASPIGQPGVGHGVTVRSRTGIARATISRSAVELRPHWHREPDSNRRCDRLEGAALATELSRHVWYWESDSNGRPPAYQAGALPG